MFLVDHYERKLEIPTKSAVIRLISNLVFFGLLLGWMVWTIHTFPFASGGTQRVQLPSANFLLVDGFDKRSVVEVDFQTIGLLSENGKAFVDKDGDALRYLVIADGIRYYHYQKYSGLPWGYDSKKEEVSGDQLYRDLYRSEGEIAAQLGATIFFVLMFLIASWGLGTREIEGSPKRELTVFEK